MRPSRWGRALRVAAGLAGKADSLASAHRPESLDEVDAARRRLAFEELFLFQLALVMRRHTRSETREAERWNRGNLVGPWLDSLPFEPTGGQRDARARSMRTCRPGARCTAS